MPMDLAAAPQEKLSKYEDYIDRHLKPYLLNATTQRDKVFEELKIFTDLRRNIEVLEKNGATAFRSMVNLGSEIYMQADVPDARTILVHVGFGFHVEFILPEALEFISVREARLSRQIEEYTHLIATIKAEIKMVHEAIREILGLPAE